MKVFLWNEKQFFEVNKKEELNENTYLITDYEQDMIRETLANSGYLWIEDNAIKWSGKAPSDVHVWNDELKEWYVDKELHDEKLKKQQSEMWTKIKQHRRDVITSGVIVKSVDKRFYTDETSVIQYSQIGSMINMGTFEPAMWKTMDETFVELTVELFSELQQAMYKNTQDNYFIAESHKHNMMQMENPLDYDYTTGWTNGEVDYTVKEITNTETNE